jgi:hypothetical protein
MKRDKGTRRAVTLQGAERAEWWPKLVAEWPRYGVYQAGTAREIPLVELR